MVEAVYRLIRGQVSGDVDLFIVRIHALPRLGAFVETRVDRRIPLHRSPRVVTRGALHHPERYAVRNVEAFRKIEYEVRHRVLHLASALEIGISHSDLLPLINEWRAPSEIGDHRQERGRLVSVFLLYAKSADTSRLIVILKHQCVPAAPVIPKLSVYEATFELSQIERLWYHLETEYVVCCQMLEVEYRVQFARFLVDISVSVLFIRGIGFTDCIRIIQRERFVIELFQEFMHARPVNIVLDTLLEVQRIFIIFERIYLRDHIEHVKTESVHALFQPETQDACHFLADFRILPVEIGLLRRKEMEVILVCALYPLPGRARERRSPVGRRYQLALFVLLSFADYVVVAIWRSLVCKRRLEPRVLIARMVENSVHHHP